MSETRYQSLVTEKSKSIKWLHILLTKQGQRPYRRYMKDYYRIIQDLHKRIDTIETLLSQE